MKYDGGRERGLSPSQETMRKFSDAVDRALFGRHHRPGGQLYGQRNAGFVVPGGEGNAGQQVFHAIRHGRERVVITYPREAPQGTDFGEHFPATCIGVQGVSQEKRTESFEPMPRVVGTADRIRGSRVLPTLTEYARDPQTILTENALGMRTVTDHEMRMVADMLTMHGKPGNRLNDDTWKNGMKTRTEASSPLSRVIRRVIPG